LSNNIIFLFLPDACAGIAKVAVDGGYDVDDEQKSSFDSKIQYTTTKIDKFSNQTNVLMKHQNHFSLNYFQ
jgi:hypothetical protein